MRKNGRASSIQNGSSCVTSSNARSMVGWAFTEKSRILFPPDEHLGGNTAFDIGVLLDQMAVWNPLTDNLEFNGNLDDVRVILWKGHCSVHENFTVANIEELRRRRPDMNIIVRPECRREAMALSDNNGSTKYIIDAQQHPDKEIVSLNPNMCPCLTMNRIDLPHLLWSLETVMTRETGNIIQVDKNTAAEAKLSLDRMLARAT